MRNVERNWDGYGTGRNVKLEEMLNCEEYETGRNI
jgi:hypothetical protein